MPQLFFLLNPLFPKGLYKESRLKGAISQKTPHLKNKQENIRAAGICLLLSAGNSIYPSFYVSSAATDMCGNAAPPQTETRCLDSFFFEDPH